MDVESNYGEPRKMDLEVGDVVRTKGQTTGERLLLVTRLEPFEDPDNSTVVPPKIGNTDVGYVRYNGDNHQEELNRGYVSGVIASWRILEVVGNVRKGTVSVE